jgi:hypothetical protein
MEKGEVGMMKSKVEFKKRFEVILLREFVFRFLFDVSFLKLYMY